MKKVPNLQKVLKKTEAQGLKSTGTGDAAHQWHYSLRHSNARVPYQSSVKFTTAAQHHSALSRLAARTLYFASTQLLLQVTTET